jgi:AAA family ATP:ADP antiporter
VIERLARRFQLEPGELKNALALGSMLFALTCSYTLVKTARDALFLAELPVSLLPWVYLGVGVLTTITALTFTRATERRPSWQVLALAALVAALSLGGFAWLFRIRAAWVPIAFYLWVNVYGLLLMSQFWMFTNSVSNPREAKRIYGVIGVGGILGGLFGGLAAAPLASTGGLSLLVVAGGVLLALLAPRLFSAARHGTFPPTEVVADDDERATHPLKFPYVRWLALASMCSVVVTGLLDFQFKSAIQQRYATPTSLASFLGLFYTVMNLAALTLQIFGTRWALQKLGAGTSAAVLPAGLAIGTAATLAAPGFGAVLTTRLWDQILRNSLNRASVELFFFPLPPGLRRRTKALIDSGLERFGDAIAGVLILLMGALMSAGLRQIAFVALVLVVVWVVAWLAVRRGYVRELAHNLRRMNLEHETGSLSLREASVLGETMRLLASPYERVVIYGMDMLAEHAPDQLAAELPWLLEHAAPAVRVRAVELAVSLQLENIHALLDTRQADADPRVRLASLRAQCSLGFHNPIDVLEEYLHSPDPEQRRLALQCAAEFVKPVDEHRLRIEFERVLREGEAADREAVAMALGHRPAPSELHELLAALIRDPDDAVRRAALRSSGRAQRRMDIAALIEALGRRELADAARAGLAAYGDRVTGTLGDYLSDPTVPSPMRHEIPRVLGDIATQEATDALLRFRERSDVRLFYRVLKSLNRIRRANAQVRFPRARVTEDLEHDVRSYLFAFVHYRSCPIGGTRSGERLLCIVLNERMDQALDRVFRRLALLYPRRDIYAAYRGVVSEDRRSRGNAIEYLENALSPVHRVMVLPLVDDSGDEERLRVAETRYGLRFADMTASLDAILQSEDTWLRTVALFVAGSRRERTLLERVEANLAARDPGVREVAAWARVALSAG